MIEKLGRFIIKNYKGVLVVSLLVTILSIYGISKLKLETQMTDMLPGNAPEVKLFEYVMDNFKGMDSVIVAVEGNKKDITAFMQEVAPQIEKVEGIYNVLYKTDTDFVEKNNLILAGEPKDIEKMSGLLTASSLKGFVKGFDSYTIVIDSDGKQQMIYKHAISTIVPSKPVNFMANSKPTEV